MDKLNIISIYDEFSKKYSDSFRGLSSHMIDFARFFKKGDTILELGCGPGFDADYLERKGMKVVGFDLSSEMIKLAKARNPKVSFNIKDMRDLDFPAGNFNGIVASFSIIHLPKKDIPKLFKKLNNFLKFKGKLYFGFQEGKSNEGLVPEPFDPKKEIFLNVFSEKEAKNILEKSGFLILKKIVRKAKSIEEWPYQKMVFIAEKT